MVRSPVVNVSERTSPESSRSVVSRWSSSESNTSSASSASKPETSAAMAVASAPAGTGSVSSITWASTARR
jgi:hypothetical protein